MKTLTVYFYGNLYSSVDLEETGIEKFEKWFNERNLVKRIINNTFSISSPKTLSVFDRSKIAFYSVENVIK